MRLRRKSIGRILYYVGVEEKCVAIFPCANFCAVHYFICRLRRRNFGCLLCTLDRFSNIPEYQECTRANSSISILLLVTHTRIDGYTKRQKRACGLTASPAYTIRRPAANPKMRDLCQKTFDSRDICNSTSSCFDS